MHFTKNYIFDGDKAWKLEQQSSFNYIFDEVNADKAWKLEQLSSFNYIFDAVNVDKAWN